MADKPAAEKTEQPTAERLRKAREEGRIPSSQELPSALVLGVLLLALALMASAIWNWMAGQVTDGLAVAGLADFNTDTCWGVLHSKGKAAFFILIPFMLVIASCAVISGLVTGGWCFAPKAVALKPERMHPVNGLKSLFSARSLVKLVVAVAKLAVVLTILFFYLRSRIDQCLGLTWASPFESFSVILGMLFGAAIRIAVAMVAIGLIDVLYQRWQYRRELRMTRQEVKEERREHELSPEVRGRIRSVQLEMARRRMLQEVPKADVVVTNPTHVAVALAYDADAMPAPTVLAKGADLLSDQIKEIARNHDVPIVERPELARTLYSTCDVGDTVPEPLYVAVAEILAMIYRLRKGRR
jgi:flagellar biosynthetic protein FlhB